MYPTKMEANGHIYPINTDYRVALACFKALEDTEITDLERFYAIETLLLGSDVLEEDEEILQKKIAIYLRCGKEENIEEEERDFDYLQDEENTRTSIRQCYHINLNEVSYMHWYEYNELISGLTEETLISKIRDLRSYDLSEEKDEKRRNKIIKVQERVALKEIHIKTKEEEELDKFWENIVGGDKDE